MPAPTARDDRPFLSVIAWPDGFSRQETAELLADAAGLDRPTLELRLGPEAVPMVYGQVDPEMARLALDTLRAHGGDGFAPTLTDLEALGSTLKIRDLQLVDGVMEIDLWRGPRTFIQRENVQILVRGTVQKAAVKNQTHSMSERDSRLISMGALGGVSGLGALGLAVTAYAAADLAANPATSVERQYTASDKLDIHTSDGVVFQIDGDKFGYTALGEMRGHGDRANMDAMCELLAHVAPNEIVDPYFPLWHPPPGHERIKLANMRLNNEEPAFAFYSRWSALMYRHLMAE